MIGVSHMNGTVAPFNETTAQCYIDSWEECGTRRDMENLGIKMDSGIAASVVASRSASLLLLRKR
jgi:hypothetical protein